MPVTLDPYGANKQGTNIKLVNANENYTYPDKLNLKPGSKLHERLVKEVKQRARESHRYMSGKHDQWREIDATLRAYVHQPDRRQTASNKSKREEKRDKFERIVMPVSYANLETLLTYMSAAFFQDPFFKYQGVGPEDVYGGMLLEKKVDMDMRRYKGDLAMHTHWRDGFAYGFGVVAPRWVKQMGYKTVIREDGFLNWMGNLFITTDRERDREWTTLYEGNKIDNVDPYRFFPDPNVAIHEVQEMEYVGWADRDSYMALLSRERNEENAFFNVKYLKHTDGRSEFIESRTQRKDSDKNARVTTNSPVDVIWMYIDLIPKEWKIGKSEYPEKWLFGLAADEVIITAQPVGLDHNMFPVAVCAPDYDGYSVLPTSKMEMVSDLQNVIDFMYSSHIMNIRKAVNDMLVVDPAIINIWDVKEPGAGKIIRMRRSMWGRGNIDQAIKQLVVQDITQANVGDADYLMQFMQRILGTTDPVSGVVNNHGPRISAAASTGARQSVLSKLERTARIIDSQSHKDVGYMLASHTQQLMEEETWVEAVGEWAKRIQEDFGIVPDSGRLQVKPLDLVVDYDILGHSGSVPGSQDAGGLLQAMQIAGQNPMLAAQLDWPRVFKHVMRQMGVKNIDDFILSSGPPQVMADEELQQEVQRGNAVPLGVGGDGSLS